MRWLRLVITIATVPCALATVQACGPADRPGAAMGGSIAGFYPLDGPCRSEGATHACHVSLPGASGVSNCFAGIQECRGGAWTTCGGRDITLMSVDVSGSRQEAQSSPSAIHPLTVALTGAGQCTLDPCDPYCRAFDEDAGITLEAGAPTTYYLPGADVFGGSPAGFAGKSNCGGSAKGCNDVAPGAPYARKCNGEGHYSIWDACLADTHCDVTRNGGAGDCVANWDVTATPDPRWDETKETWTPAVCAGTDLTVSAACEVAGVAGFNVCNRGNSPMLAASVGIYIDNGNADFGSSTFAGGSCPIVAPTCSPAVPGGTLGAGRCFRVTNASCPAWTGGGNPVAYVNSNAAVTECGGRATAGSATGPGCNNNWADVKHKGIVCAGSSSFIDSSRSFSYVGTCATGFSVRWKFLTYQATVPCSPGACNGSNAAKVEFYGTLSTAVPAPASAPEALIPAATTTQSINCTYGVDAGGQPVCPVDLTTWANGVVMNGASYQTLDLRIRLIPTPDDAQSPTVASWALSYDCVPSE